jgi:hypothetical protein
VDRTLPRTAATVFISVAGAVVPASTPWFLAAMVEAQARPERSLEELSLEEMAEGVPETVKTVFRPPGMGEVEYREVAETVLVRISCLEVGVEAVLHPRPVTREERA